MALHLDFPLLHRRNSEMAAVVRDDQISVHANGGRQDVPVARIVGHRFDERLKAFDPSLRKVPSQFGLPPGAMEEKRALWRRKRLAAMPALRGTDRRDHRRLSIASLIGRYE